MKRIGILFLVLFISSFTSISFSQTDSTTTLNLQGKTALLFQIGYNFQLSSYEGQLLSMKKMIDNDHGWRLGVSLSARHYINENSATTTSSLSTGISYSQVYYFSSTDMIRGYYGLGARTSFDTNWNDTGRNDNFTIGPIGYLGVEWMVTKKIGLSAEYGCQIYYTLNFSKYYSGNSRSGSHTIGLSQDGVRFGAALYF